MPYRRLKDAGIELGVGSDVAAGDTFSIPDVLNVAFKVHKSGPGGYVLGAEELLHLGTLGGARVLGLDHRIGNFDAGKEADFVVVDPGRHPLLGRRLGEIDSGAAGREARLFALLMGMGYATITGTWVRGEAVFSAS